MTSSIEQKAMDAGLMEQLDRYDRALEAQDLSSLDHLLTDDFIQISPAAVARNKAEWFAWFNCIVKYDRMRRQIVGSRSFADTSIVLSECSPVMRVKGGEPSVHIAFMLEVWTNRDGCWQKAVEQFTRPPPRSE